MVPAAGWVFGADPLQCGETRGAWGAWVERGENARTAAPSCWVPILSPSQRVGIRVAEPDPLDRAPLCPHQCPVLVMAVGSRFGLARDLQL